MKRPAWEDYGYAGGSGFAPPSTAPTIQQPPQPVQAPDFQGPTVVNPTRPPGEPPSGIAPPLGSRSGGPQGHTSFPMKGALPGFSSQNVPKTGRQGV